MSWQSFRAQKPVRGIRRSRPGRLLAATGLAACAVMALPAPFAHAATVNVPCSVRKLVKAINTANSSPGADTLRLARKCTYKLTSADTANPGNGLPAISSEITIDGNGATITRAKSAPDFRILLVAGTGTLTLNKATISGGRATTTDCPLFPGQGTCGGGILNLGTLTVNHSRVINNIATSDLFAEGGGIDNDGTATLNDTDVSGNTAEYTGTDLSGAAGGAIANDGPLTVNCSYVHHNTVTVTPDTGSTATGSGIATFAQTTIKGSLISHNHADAPGGATLAALSNGAPGSVTDTVIRDNTSSARGGDALGGGVATSALLTLTRTAVIGNLATAPGGTARAGGIQVGRLADLRLNNSTVRGNSAGAPDGGTAQGGGLANATGGTITSDRSEIRGNTAKAPDGGTAQGGGIFTDVGATTLNRSAVTDNRAGDGGGIFEGPNGTVTLNNTAVKRNKPNNCAPPNSVPGCIG